VLPFFLPFFAVVDLFIHAVQAAHPDELLRWVRDSSPRLVLPRVRLNVFREERFSHIPPSFPALQAGTRFTSSCVSCSRSRSRLYDEDSCLTTFLLLRPSRHVKRSCLPDVLFPLAFSAFRFPTGVVFRGDGLLSAVNSGMKGRPHLFAGLLLFPFHKLLHSFPLLSSRPTRPAPWQTTAVFDVYVSLPLWLRLNQRYASVLFFPPQVPFEARLDADEPRTSCLADV